MALTGSMPPCMRPGPTSIAIPASPTATPSHVIGRGRLPSGRIASSTTSHSGTDATTTATSPEGACCADHTTAPLPPRNSRAPITSADLHSARPGGGAPVMSARPSRIPPALSIRMLAISSGGMVWTAILIAR